MEASLGKLDGKGQVIGPDGKVKSEFRIHSDVTAEQYKALVKEAIQNAKETDQSWLRSLANFSLTPEKWEQIKKNSAFINFLNNLDSQQQTKNDDG